MSNFKNEFKAGFTKTVMELFKKVLSEKTENTSKELNPTQTGGMDPTSIESQQKTMKKGDVKLTKVHQYYDATIYEGIIYEGEVDGKESEILFNIKDRTKPLPIEEEEDEEEEEDSDEEEGE